MRSRRSLKIVFGALKSYYENQQEKKAMKESIDSYYNEVLLERSFRSFAQFLGQVKVKRQRQKEADLLLKQHWFNRICKKSNLNKEQFNGAADEHHEFYRLRTCLMAFKVYTERRRETRVQKEQAQLFSDIRKKITVFRALALNSV